MAKLTEQQQQAVAQWAGAGATLNDIQTRLKETFGVVLTYFETRMLVMELGVSPGDKKRDQPTAVPPSPPPPPDAEEPPYDDDEGYGDADLLPPDSHTGSGNVTVALDSITLPGTMASGKVTFSDGTQAVWYLDQFGRLGLRNAPPGYQPPAADIPSFQQQLQKLLS